MSNTRFEQFKINMGKVGLEFDERIEQREGDGQLGLFATEMIPAGTLLTKFPLKNRVANETGVDYGAYPNSDILNTIHGIAAALSSHSETYKDYFEYCGTLESRKAGSSASFLEEEDFKLLHGMNPLLAKAAFRAKAQFVAIANQIKSQDKTLDDDSVDWATSIWMDRCWTDLGFIPGVDLFNHKTTSTIALQKAIIDGEEFAVLEAAEDIESGAEIFVNYGKKDAFRLLTHFGFHDASDLHLISYSTRIEQEVKDDFSAQVVNLLKKHYDVAEYEIEGTPYFRVLEANAFFLEQGPNNKMVDLASRLAVANEEQILAGQSDLQTTTSYLLHILMTYKKSNRVHEVSVESLPAKLHPYHQMLTKEAAVVDHNIEVVKAKLLTH